MTVDFILFLFFVNPRTPIIISTVSIYYITRTAFHPTHTHLGSVNTSTIVDTLSRPWFIHTHARAFDGPRLIGGNYSNRTTFETDTAVSSLQPSDTDLKDLEYTSGVHPPGCLIIIIYTYYHHLYNVHIIH